MEKTRQNSDYFFKLFESQILRFTFLSRFFSRFSSRARFLARFSSLRFLRSNLSSSVFDLLLSTQRSKIFKGMKSNYQLQEKIDLLFIIFDHYYNGIGIARIGSTFFFFLTL